ncbi:sensor histidine kinase [Sinosporangium siamense]|uniref:histidine kinase n=1 Tax=Sinosporangium siamense TaxID=1367973 RepID=A0A919RPY5_9ACTN|nr:HAMP domain-containing sensor histidine kinase [Sinosporangium siamense]GII96054.1 hypothetical protein Ssi02_62850 [Sinosporangium siamense]
MSLRARLFAGLLVVSATLLVTLSAVSVLVLRGHLTQRLEDQLITASATTSHRVAAAPGGRLDRTLTGSDYAAAVFNAGTGRARLVNGDAAEAFAVPGLVERAGREALVGYAAREETFNLANGMMARARAQDRNPDRIVVVAVPMDSVEAPVRRLIVAELVTGGVLILVLALSGHVLIVGGLSPLAKMAGVAHRVAMGGDLSVRMPEGGSEIGRLGSAVNLMLERIAGAFRDRWASEERVRQFAADASHELRTPLSAIRGYAELYRTGAIPADDLPKIMKRIEDEAARMGDMVGQLLELARLDRAAGLSLAPTDLVAVAREVAGDQQAVAPGAEVVVDAPATLPAVVDEARVRQVLVNLLANVRAHTPGGTVAVVRLSRPHHGGALIEVADDGSGMPDPERAFDRFHKRGSDGAGLGLAIVRAVTHAHGGRCWITSGPSGTTVHVDLPPRADPAIA